jgi:uncharacterized membrane protein (UPF0127 family)
MSVLSCVKLSAQRVILRNPLSRIFFTLLIAVFLSGQSYTVADLDADFERDVLVISASEHACYRFDVWLALTNSQFARGLMHVRKLPDDAGMLFVYAEPDGRSMWMKNTYIPLDILFIRNNGTVSSVARHTEPLSLRSIASVEPVTLVLELNAGTADRLKIGTDNQIYWFNVP